ncbi:MAG: hypothetical protein JO295_01315 [Verrucomicrobia bacterium]|nr:hypothetical protein [Verrucomicrobiota bacterium]
MDRHLSPILFGANFGDSEAPTHTAFGLATAWEMGFKENWLQRAIAQNIELVIAACREAGLTEETWMFWAREFAVESVGIIDILLVSESGRIAIVETKLSYNPEGRRSVVAQTLEYAIHFPSVDSSRLPPVPELNGRPFADQDSVQRRIQEGDFLIIITGDRLDSRAVKLGQSLLGRHLVRGWELALVEVAVFRAVPDDGSRQGLLVPHLRGAIIPERRQVVRIKVEGDRTRVDVETAAPVATDAPPKLTEEEFFAKLPVDQRDFADELRVLRANYPSVVFRFEKTFGTTALIFETRKKNILELYPDGQIKFREWEFEKDLGQELGSYYKEKLRSLFPKAMKSYTSIERLDAGRAEQLLALLKEILGKVSFPPT